ncbi:tetratricopeptide repeat protein [Actinoplanes bogorensis]|uniref:Tetratricopeptide repeat protein n=1 Tax=Paractinoplanes bogorensis TaxID=1610840 RepID=A0ABS5YIS2_9ACTN|nr:tetratricopeptide repeat protein [Actinoplanes bogorensis]MBU2662643.1 tetratricopeptide repeat protein [Actinoplanes bogorensis]
MNELGRRIVELRLSRGLSQEQLAGKTGLGLRTIGDIERGTTRRPHRETLRVLCDGLGTDAAERAELYGLARKKAPPSTRLRKSKRPDLAAAPTALLGRDDELAQLAALVLDPGVRLVSVVGAGGVGKSRLALEAGWRLAGRFDRVAGADLSVLDDPADVPQAVADAVRCRGVGREPLDALVQLIGDRRWLLVLDSFEHVAGAARWVADLLGRCHRLTVLATSRSPLRLRSEHVLRLLPLAGADAVGLLVERASAVRLGFRRTDDNAAALDALCRRLDRLPLAIELAAAQLAVQEPGELLAELPELLGAADMPERHQTLRLTVEWSTGRLDERERLVLGALAIFAGGAAPGDLEAVLSAAGITVPRVRGSVGQLAADSLVTLIDRDGDARITMLDTVREVAAGPDSVREAHALFFLALVRAGDDRVDAERDNVRAAVSWSVTHRPETLDVPLVKALTAVHVARARFGEASRTLLRIAEATTASPVRAWALHGASIAANEAGRPEEALRLATRCTELFDEDSDVSAALTVAGNAQKFLGHYAEARASHRASLDLARAAGDRRRVTISLNNLGTLAHDRGEYDRAREHYRDSLAIKEELGDRRGAAVTRMNLAGVENDLGAYASSHEHLVAAVAAFRELNDTSPTAYALGMLAEARLGSDLVDEAEATAREALEMARAAEYRPGIGLALARLGDVALARGDRDAAAKLLTEAFGHANGRPEQARTLDRLAAATLSRDFLHRAAELRATHDLPVPPADRELHLYLAEKLAVSPA